ncbi:diaminopimelate epimerase [Fontimonas thermophila]|uniref:Diaminopimelate epimerase n=1 Tax=Fontimonas thermophila TaxID=1076937 RepID=A0A1I2JEC5_9GAMM|nr:diaminopimelate epimerase [Fontimonas thermophila]SFF51206.1 diaminopimelate epimerase [Fontimonas thermophila]
MRLAFTKMHGAGNDFVVIDATRTPFAPTPALLRRLTDRRFGVGCDQVLVIEPPSTPDVDFDYRIFNADGSEAGQCGNGARALARYVREAGLSDKDRIRVRTSTSVLELGYAGDGLYTVDMGVPRLDPDEIPLRVGARAIRYALTLDGIGAVEFGAVSMGNPHAVLPVAAVETAPVESLGAALQAHPAFPQSVNVGFLQVISRERARLRVCERGVGETLACGSGACAAAVIGQLWGLLGEDVAMELRGGVLRIRWPGEGHPVQMTGPAETVFRGEIEWPS